MFTRSLPFCLLKQTRFSSTNVSLGEILCVNLLVNVTDTDDIDLRTRLLEELKISLKVCSLECISIMNHNSTMAPC